MNIKPVTEPGVYLNPGVLYIDNRLWHWYFDMSLLETMEIVCCEYIKLDRSVYGPITILDISDNVNELPITYHGTAKNKER